MNLPSRLVGEIPKRVRIIADGRCGTVDLVYYDRLHTGNSYDELVVTLDDGPCVCGAAHLFEEIDSPAPAPVHQGGYYGA